MEHHLGFILWGDERGRYSGRESVPLCFHTQIQGRPQPGAKVTPPGFQKKKKKKKKEIEEQKEREREKTQETDFEHTM